ncbi:MAG: MOSC N-terminal beta barrel domain-containing protein [Planctomycetia bacterium]|nr:MOSC N-terminal beta barrel domain-containing protein [Planctomycetia bacterium]
MPTLDLITLYPVKSLDGLAVPAARVLPSGALENDRRWRLVDMEGRVVNAKRTPLFHAIRAEFALDERLITLCVAPAALTAAAIPGINRLQNLAPDSFHLVPGEKGPCGWLSEALGIGVLLEERPDGGFPDDRDAPGPTLISTASLAEVARWFGFDLAEARRRFRVKCRDRRLRCLLGRHAREPRAATSQPLIGRPAGRSPGRSLRPSSAAGAQGILDRRSPVSGDERLQAVRRAEPREHNRRGHRPLPRRVRSPLGQGPPPRRRRERVGASLPAGGEHRMRVGRRHLP